MLNRQEGTVRQWARGAVKIPPDVAEWLKLMADFHENNPAPAKTRQNPAWICQPCGETYGNRKPVQATWHQGECDKCRQIRPVTQPRDFGIINFHNAANSAHPHFLLAPRP
jgi:hypothetical protein